MSVLCLQIATCNDFTIQSLYYQ